MEKQSDLANHEIVTIAVLLCGGATKAVDTEDIAMKANEIAPGRFTWRKYPQQIMLEHIRVFLSDAKKPKNGSYISGSGDDGWMLTPAGQSFCERAVKTLRVSHSQKLPMSSEEKRWMSRERKRLLASPTTTKIHNGLDAEISLREAEEFFKLDDYVVGTTRERRLDRYLNLFQNDRELGPLVSHLAKRVREGLSI
jgi:hypothetical protein